MEADISILLKTGHLYFALTGSVCGCGAAGERGHAEGLGVYSAHAKSKLGIQMRNLSHGNTYIPLSGAQVWVVVCRPALSLVRAS